MKRDIQADLIAAVELAVADPKVEAVTVLVASVDPALIAKAAPMLAARLWPGDRFGAVLWSEPVEAPEWSTAWGDLWSEVAVEKLRARDLTPTAGAVAPPPGSRS